jgi:hypothetical protein
VSSGRPGGTRTLIAAAGIRVVLKVTEPILVGEQLHSPHYLQLHDGGGPTKVVEGVRQLTALLVIASILWLDVFQGGSNTRLGHRGCCRTRKLRSFRR